MAFTGWLDLDGSEVANSSRVVAHLSPGVPSDDSVFTEAVSCGCGGEVIYDDSWPGLAAFLGDDDYSNDVTNAPWYDADVPQSSEFRGVWPMKIDGLGAPPVDRKISELVGDGGVASPARVRSRRVTVDALLIACTSAGLEYGIRWLQCVLKPTTTAGESMLSYLAAHPGYSAVDAESLRRSLYRVVLTGSVEAQRQWAGGGTQNQQATSARVRWSMTALSPYAYLPGVDDAVVWDSTATTSIKWVHAADCTAPGSCPGMPVLFSADCVPEQIPRAVTPPPVCGGCLPVGDIDTHTYRIPTIDDPGGCRETAVTMRIINTGGDPLSLQAFWRACDSNLACELHQFPLQVAGLPSASELWLDGVSERYWAMFNGRKHRPVGVVGTPTGAPWRPPVIDRGGCYDLVVQTAPDTEFELELIYNDREP